MKISKQTLFTLLFLMCVTVAVPSSFAQTSQRDSAPNPSTEACEDLLTEHTSLLDMEFPETAFDSENQAYFKFENFEQAIKFMQKGHRLSRSKPNERAPYILPLLKGLRELVIHPTQKEDLNPQQVRELTKAIKMWMNTLNQARSSNFRIEERVFTQISQVAVQLSSSKIYRDLDHPFELESFSAIYYTLNRIPSQKLVRKWMISYSKALPKVRTYLNFLNITTFFQYISPEDLQENQILKSWLKHERELSRVEEIEDHPLPVVRALKILIGVDPKVARAFYKNNQETFLNLLYNEPALVSPPLAYLHYVLGEQIPELEQIDLRPYFVADKPQSELERKVGKWLSLMGLDAQENIALPGLPFLEMDYYFELKNGRKINVEVDGPQHFVEDDGGDLLQRNSDLRRDELLETFGIEVFRIPYYVFEDLDQYQPEEILREYIMDGPE